MANNVKETLVTFVKDVFPHVKGDVVKIENEALKLIDKAAYLVGDKGDDVTPKRSDNEPPVVETAQTQADAAAQAAADKEAAQKAADEAELADAQTKLDAIASQEQPAEDESTDEVATPPADVQEQPAE